MTIAPFRQFPHPVRHGHVQVQYLPHRVRHLPGPNEFSPVRK
jgi:hypothetical protein